MSSQSPKSGSPTKPDTQDSSEIASKLRGEIEKLKVSFESKNFQTLLLLLRELKAKHINCFSPSARGGVRDREHRESMG